jgi:hypothetical protein
VLSPAELAAIQLEISANLPLQQDLAAALLPDTCLVYRDTPGRSPSGQPIVVADPSPRTIACRVSPAGGGLHERAVAERLIDVNSWDIAVPAGTDVVESDRIVYQGVTFEILAVQGPRSFETERMVVARKKPL